MPSDDYTSISRGPLKLKGAAGVTKKKKKKAGKDKAAATDLEKNLSAGEGALVPTIDTPREERDDDVDDDTRSRSRSRDKKGDGGEEEEDESKTETERRFAEAKRKRVCCNTPLLFVLSFFFKKKMG